ncbi:MAG: hypothetical protein LBM60_03270 [Clostridium sp.]|jgi:hypothetical protein|nr:hypothetical protein [Clostridium sp.]
MDDYENELIHAPKAQIGASLKVSVSNALIDTRAVGAQIGASMKNIKMKNIIKTLLSVILILGIMTGCTLGNATDEQPSIPDVSAPISPDTVSPDATQDNTDSAKVDMALSDIIDAIYEKKPVPIALGTRSIDLTDADAVLSSAGLSSTDMVTEIAVSEAMIGSQAYSLVLARLVDSGDAKTVAEEMKAGINPAKWICVAADDMSVVASGDVVMLIMLSSELADSVTSDELADAFESVCGSLSVDI